MAVSKKIRDSMENSSWIRRMFEAGAALRAVHGAEKVFDFSLGNPDVDAAIGNYILQINVGSNAGAEVNRVAAGHSMRPPSTARSGHV